ncbi:MAG: hypothetical protein LBK61_06165 [Spirochaetaceae bacterium]|jgi:hypothetical protein|nr:hypothetical protein [Spirochaetaceae bacterium]
MIAFGQNILSGDGNPANADVSGNGGDRPHTRLRIASATAQEELKDRTAQTAGAHNIPAQIDGKITEHSADQTAHGIPGQIAAKITEHNANGNENAHTDMRLDIIDLNEKKAPKENPVFSGTVNMEGAVAEVSQPRDYRAEGKPAPYGNPAQPATVKDFTDVFNVSVQTAGGLLREYDHDGPPDFFKFLKTVDVDKAHECFKDGEEAAFREVDYYHANYADYLTQKDRDAMNRNLRTLEELLMSLSGEKLRVADRVSGMEGFVQRCVDRAWGAEEARMTDARVAGEGGIYAGIYDDAEWV